ncbi:MAG: hypothetical protein CMJ78_09920 [Planctomycetaceae bacterium]|nr:hypothetical protein [Planctomycetaceae bacterium]
MVTGALLATLFANGTPTLTADADEKTATKKPPVERHRTTNEKRPVFVQQSTLAVVRNQERFRLYVGRCSRSLQFKKSYSTFDQAMTPAQVERESKDIRATRIYSTDFADSVSYWRDSNSREYRVYVSVWQLHSTHTSSQEAHATAKKLKETSLSSPQVITHYSAQ